MPEVTRAVLAYSLHARMGASIVDYPDYFRRLADVAGTARQTSVGTNLVAISSMAPVGPAWLLRVVMGDESAAPVFFNPQTGEEAEGRLAGQILANAVWVLVNPETRQVAMEQKRPGVPVATFAGALSHLSAELRLTDTRATFDLNPIASEGFLADIERYERIRQATVSIAEPNYSWSDNATVLTGYAEESGGATVDLTITAPRGESLAKGAGIVADIKKLAATKIGPLKNVKIRGRRGSDKKETTTSLQKHQERASYEVSSTDNLSDQRGAFTEAAGSLLAQIPLDEPNAEG